MDKETAIKTLPAKLSQEAIEELKNIYQEEYGETLSDADALDLGQRLLRLFQIVYRPLPFDSHDSHSKNYPTH